MATQADAINRYFDAVETTGRNVGNLRYYLHSLFRGVDVRARSVLDIGAGDGLLSFYAASAGASSVVSLEPEAAGSATGTITRLPTWQPSWATAQSNSCRRRSRTTHVPRAPSTSSSSIKQ